MALVRRPLILLPAAVVALASAACGSPTTATSTPSATTTTAETNAPALSGDITVFAAASLTESFKEVGDAFTRANPGVKVTFTFDASSALVTQIIQGAPADVFASADIATMGKLTAAAQNGSAPVTFATNVLQIIVGAGNPNGVSGLTDLARSSLKVVLCDPSVPCGKYAKQALDAVRVSVTPASLEQNVKGVVTKVTVGEADAGIVYATDVKAAGAKVTGVAIPAEHNVAATYPVALTKASKHADVGLAFISFLSSADGKAIVAKYGFGTP
jgi:molybdate transport system substrate-binding protein